MPSVDLRTVQHVAYLDIEAIREKETDEKQPVIALTGDTYPVKERIKREGGRWFSKGKFWYLPADTPDGKLAEILNGLNRGARRPIIAQDEFIPVDPFRQFDAWTPTVIGLLHEERGDHPLIFTTQLVDEECTRERLVEDLHGVDLIVTYNGRAHKDKVWGNLGYDIPVLDENYALDLERHYSCLDICPVCWYFTWDGRRIYDPKEYEGDEQIGGGLKKIAQRLELAERFDYEDLADGEESAEIWKEYKRTGDEDLLRKYCYYNLVDLQILRELFIKLIYMGYDGFEG